ncbi:MAG: hypothetical protein ACYC9N_22940, partial [Thermoanaerobaculia bacterium]
ALGGVENAAHTSAAFPTPPTATAAAASIRKDPQILRGRQNFRVALILDDEAPVHVRGRRINDSSKHGNEIVAQNIEPKVAKKYVRRLPNA